MDDFLQKAFHIDEDLTEINEKAIGFPPTSGKEYLRRVRKEAGSCPDIVVASLDVSTFHRNQTVKVLNSNGCQPAPQGYAASLHWQNAQVANFSELRQNLARLRADTAVAAKLRQRNDLPEEDDELGWHQFCFGNSLPLKQFSLIEADQQSQDALPPLLSIMLALDQPTVEQLLAFHISWFKETGFSHLQGQWLFALLACLEKPLTPEACHLIRTLARLCTNLRATLDDADHEHLAALNLLLCLAARYFDQQDLADQPLS